MQKLMTVSNPGDLRARVEIWLDRGHSRPGRQLLHAVSYQDQCELDRRTVPWDAGESLAASARRVCQEVCSGLGWQAAQLQR